MKNKWALVVGLGLGLVAVVLMNVYMYSSQQAYTLMRFTRAASRGDAISQALLSSVPVPESFGSVLTEAIMARDVEWVIGKLLVEDVAAGDFLQYAHVSAPPEADFERRIDKHKRGLAIQVSDETGAGGFVEPGSFVDIIATMVQPKDADHPQPRIATKTILQRIKVLAVGNRSTRSRAGEGRRRSGGSTTVMLELLPIQAEKVIFAQHHAQGALTLALVPPDGPPLLPEVPVNWDSFDDIR